MLYSLIGKCYGKAVKRRRCEFENSLSVIVFAEKKKIAGSQKYTKDIPLMIQSILKHHADHLSSELNFGFSRAKSAIVNCYVLIVVIFCIVHSFYHFVIMINTLLEYLRITRQSQFTNH